MSATINFTESQTLAAVRSFLLSILPAGIEVIRGQINRVPEPVSPDFVVMTPILRRRISTNVDVYLDIILTGSIAGNILSVTAIQGGRLRVGSVLLGKSGVAAGQVVTAFGTGTGGTGTYVVSQPQTLAAQTMYAGELDALQPTELTVQCDVHGPASGENAQIMSTLWRDMYAVDVLAPSVGLDIAPLYADDPRQAPFVNDQDQWEFRWSVDLHLQANWTAKVLQQFADQLKINLAMVEREIPVPGVGAFLVAGGLVLVAGGQRLVVGAS